MAMQVEVVRLVPGQDVRLALQELVENRRWRAACVLSGLGSLTTAVLRHAGREDATEIAGPLELLTLAGTLGTGGMHLHASVADARGQVSGGHVMPGNRVRTTAEIVIGVLEDWEFERVQDTETGYRELMARRIDAPG